MSAPRDQQAESTETETSGTQETARLLNRGSKAALYVAFFSVWTTMILFAVFSTPYPVVPSCSHEPSVNMVTTPTINGYEIEVARPSRQEALIAYKVSVLKDDTPWSDMSVELTGGMEIRNTDGDEWLNFTDLTRDDMLTGGDFFTLEDLTSGSKYEVILLFMWGPNECEITSEVMYVP